MPTLSLNVTKARQNKDGSYPIRISIASQGRTVFITTRFKVDNLKQWNGSRVVRHPQAEAMNRKLNLMLEEYRSQIDENPYLESLPAQALKDKLVRGRCGVSTAQEFGQEYVKQLRKEKRTSYAKNMEYTLKYLTECFGQDLPLSSIGVVEIKRWEKFLFGRGDSTTTVNIRMSHLKALLNAAVIEGKVEYKIFPFRQYRMPAKEVRDICISREELAKLCEAEFDGVSQKRLTVARDLFLLSFYCAGINLTDLVDAELAGEYLTFVRKKTSDRKTGERRVSITIQPEAREIIDRYITEDGRMDFGYHYTDYEQFRSFVTKSLNRIGEMLGFEKRLMFYSARKTFCQFGYEIGVPLYVLEYAIGQTIKEANNRPIFNYIRIMRGQADTSIRAIIDFAKGINP
ncbi:MAG: site-specific integrase [Muribaculaceae bacterium]|nr:site-specific integrase [Muribaculaceae bacterium]